METKQKQSLKDRRQGGVIGAIASAVAASVCCLGPLVLLALGVSGAWIGNLTAFEPYRPIFMVATFVFLGFAFYKVYRKPQEACATESYCANPKAERINKTVLWIVTILAVGLLALPYALPYLASANQEEGQAVRIVASGSQTKQAGSQTKQAYSQEKRRVPPGSKTKTVILDVRNMTCGSCPITVRKSLERLDGVLEVKATLKPPEAIVTYDPSRISIRDMIAATTNVGYPSSVRPEGKGK